MKILVVGGGGREHAIIRALKKSPRCSEIWCAPGNGGISYDAHCKAIPATDVDAMVKFAKEEAFDYVVVAQDDPLALGMVDALAAVGIPAFGPDKAAARIEASKVFSKDLMKKYGIPFRVGHHFASDVVTYARANNITPADFSYEDAKTIYAKSVADVAKEDPSIPKTFPMTAEEWKNAKDPVAIVHNRAVKGGPQPSELNKMIEMAKKDLANNEAWVASTENQLSQSEKKLNNDFDQMLK